MPVNPSSAFSVFVVNRETLKVPDFQRNFAWKEEMVEELWKDIQSLSGSEQHYLGAIIIQEDAEGSGVSVVDGQQRLASLTILAIACRNVLRAIAHGVYPGRTPSPQQQDLLDDAKNNITGLIGYYDENMNLCRRLHLNSSEDERYSADVYESDAFKSFDCAPNTKRYLKAFSYFLEKIGSDVLVGEHWVTALRGLVVKVYARLVFTVVTVNSDEDAFEVFESLNSKGESLAASDLLKNRLLMMCPSNEDKATALGLWEDAVEKCESGRFDIVDSIWMYWNAFENTGVTKKALYRKIKQQKLATPGPGIVPFVTDLRDNLEVLSGWVDRGRRYPPKSSNDTETALSELSTLGYRSCYPALLLANKKVPKITGDLIEMSLRFLVRNITIAKRRVRVAEELFNVVLGEISAYDPQNNQPNALKVLQGELERLFADRDVSDDAMLTALRTERYEDNKIAKYIWSKVYYHEAGGAFDLSNNVHLEHILPQSPVTHWGGFLVPDHNGGEVTRAQDENIWDRFVDDWIYHIGNMALLHKKPNAAIGNRALAIKLPAYRAYDPTNNPVGSELASTNDVADQVDLNGGNWTVGLIRDRAERYICGNATKVWPAF